MIIFPSFRNVSNQKRQIAGIGIQMRYIIWSWEVASEGTCLGSELFLGPRKNRLEAGPSRFWTKRIQKTIPSVSQHALPPVARLLCAEEKRGGSDGVTVLAVVEKVSLDIDIEKNGDI